jgi:flagellar hook-associated protein 3 FlgL
MSISTIDPRTAFQGAQLRNLQNQINDLSQQLTTQKKAPDYAGMGSDRGVAIALRSRISDIDSVTSTVTNVNARLDVGTNALEGIIKIVNQTHAVITSSLEVTSTGQTISQAGARDSLNQFLQLLNSKVGDRYLFSGLSTDQAPTVTSDDILNGNGTQAGVKQLIAERAQADVGAAPSKGRLLLTPTPQTGTAITLTEDTTSPLFGLKLASITSSSGNLAVTSPTGNPATESLNVATNPNPGDKVTFNFNLPDGSHESIALTATAGPAVQPGEFLIGTSAANTAIAINSKLSDRLDSLVRGPLSAASAVQASKEFFDDPPQRVVGVPLTSATALAPDPTNTVAWYTGENGPLPARDTSTARIDQGETLNYGARANEDAFKLQLQNLTALAAASTSASNPDAQSFVAALYDRVGQGTIPQPGQQSVQEIEGEFAGAQNAAKAATDRQAQTKNVALDLLNSIEGVDKETVSVELLAVQNSLDASFKTTSLLANSSLLKFL